MANIFENVTMTTRLWQYLGFLKNSKANKCSCYLPWNIIRTWLVYGACMSPYYYLQDYCGAIKVTHQKPYVTFSAFSIAYLLPSNQNHWQMNKIKWCALSSYCHRTLFQVLWKLFEYFQSYHNIFIIESIFICCHSNQNRWYKNKTKKNALITMLTS